MSKNNNAKKGQLKKGANPEASINEASSQLKHKEKRAKVKDKFKSQYEGRIVRSLEYYELLLKELTSVEYVSKLKSRNDEQKVEDQHQSTKIPSTTDSSNLLSSSQVADAMVLCEKLPEEEQETMVKDVEMNMDLSDFNLESEWTIEMTEEAHKWFRKHTKRQNDFCKRVIRRLKILSTGRWPYVLCKPLKTKKSSAKLYESKIDSGSRIIWEVAISFSPRRSSAGNSFSEQ